ncbi:hypothetical protein BpHYR1_048012 [Brachionus plicatilis]|uniref:Uncharacterized protein n=1 Tax=Brachionus plicatilis TaxID=10195 RepID=A0A3M7TAA5_BRAPC|nr:hypothetical protein BpHYR1_048012 [Brachionus plicatilis]
MNIQKQNKFKKRQKKQYLCIFYYQILLPFLSKKCYLKHTFQQANYSSQHNYIFENTKLPILLILINLTLINKKIPNLHLNHLHIARANNSPKSMNGNYSFFLKGKDDVEIDLRCSLQIGYLSAIKY